jgi:hypothetical protein
MIAIYKTGSLLRALRDLRGFLAGLMANWYHAVQPTSVGPPTQFGRVAQKLSRAALRHSRKSIIMVSGQFL